MALQNGPADPPKINVGDSDNARGQLVDGAPAKAKKSKRDKNVKDTELYSEAEYHAIRVRTKKQRLARHFLCETIFYFLFVALFCSVTFVLRSSWSFYSADVVRTMVLREPYDDEKSTFAEGMDQPSKFWLWAERILIPTIYPTFNYNGEPLTPYERLFATQQNRVLGAIRLRQVRSPVNGPGCIIDQQMSGLLFECYPDYDSSTEDTTPFDLLPTGEPKYRNYTRIAGAFRYRDQEDLCGRQEGKYCSAVVVGRRGNSYTAGGYTFDLVQNASQALSDLKALERAGWIDRGTRAVMIDFTFFNANVRLLVASSLLVELLPTGVILTKASIKPTEILALATLSDYVTLILECVLAAWVLFYIAREVHEFALYARVKSHRCISCLEKAIMREGREKKLPCPECGREFNSFRQAVCPECQAEVSQTHRCWRGYFEDPWNWLDVINLVFFLVVFGIRFSVRIDLQSQTFDVRPDEFLLFFPIAWQIVLANYVNSVNALLCFLKTFKYLGKFKSLSALVRTLFVAKTELANFLVIFLIIFVGFGLSFHLAFGTDIAGFRDWFTSMTTLFQMLLGDFDYDALHNSHRVLAPLFFVLYQILVFFVLANMFIAIISGAHAQAKEESFTGSTDLLGSALILYWHDLRSKLSKYKVFFCFGRNRALDDIKSILVGLQKSPQVAAQHPEAVDEVRTFKYQIEHSPDDFELFAAVLSAFSEAYPDTLISSKTVWTIDDYEILKMAVTNHKRQVRNRRARTGVWEDDDDMGAKGTERVQTQGGDKSSAGITPNGGHSGGLSPGGHGGRRKSVMSPADEGLQNRVGRVQQGVDDVRAMMSQLLQKVW